MRAAVLLPLALLAPLALPPSTAEEACVNVEDHEGTGGVGVTPILGEQVGATVRAPAPVAHRVTAYVSPDDCCPPSLCGVLVLRLP